MGLFGSSFNQADPSGYLMNIGGQQQPQNPWEMAMQPTQRQAAQQFQQQYGYQTPGIGDEVRGTQPIGNMQPQQLPTDPRAAQAARPGFFGKGGRGWGILGVIGDGLQVAGGGRATYQDHMQQQQEYAQRLQELQAEREARRAERMMPRAEQVGDSIGMLDPSTGSFTPTYTAPPKENVPDVVRSLMAAGIDPTSEEGRRYIVGSIRNSPEAIGAQTELADHRFGNSLRLKQTPGASSGGGPRGGGMGKLKVGQVVSGHTYVGGDPNNRASWR